MRSKSINQYNITSIYGFHAIKFLAVGLGLICFLLLVLIENRGAYIGIIFLPLSFLLVSLCFNYRKSIKGLGGFIICIAYMLRFTVFPVIIALGNYRLDIDLSIVEPFFNRACLIMIIEMTVVFILLTYLGMRRAKRTQEASEKEATHVSNIERICENKFLKAVIGLFLLYNIFVYALYPQLLTVYWRNIFFMGDSVERLTVLTRLISSIPGFLYYPFKLTAELLHYLITIVLVVKVNKNSKTVMRNWVLTLLILICSFSILSSEQINSIIIVITIVYYMLFKYQKFDRAIVTIGVIAFCVIACFVFVNIANASDLGSLGRVLDNYFNGPLNTAAALHMRQHLNLGTSWFLKDILNAIPIIGKRTGAVSLNDFYGEFYQMPGAIIPMAGYGYYYLGYVGCWIPAALIVCTANMFDELHLRRMKSEYKMILTICVVHTAICVFMYNLCIYFSTWVYTFAPLVIIYGIDNRRALKHNVSLRTVTVSCGESK